MSNNKILIIDDDLDILETTGALLLREGFDIHFSETIERGMDIIEKIRPDLILLDIMFPEKKTRGFEASTEIKNKYPHIPVFILTAINREYAFDFNKDDVKAEEFINKPVKIDNLVELIKKHIQ